MWIFNCLCVNTLYTLSFTLIWNFSEIDSGFSQFGQYYPVLTCLIDTYWRDSVRFYSTCYSIFMTSGLMWCCLHTVAVIFAFRYIFRVKPKLLNLWWLYFVWMEVLSTSEGSVLVSFLFIIALLMGNNLYKED